MSGEVDVITGSVAFGMGIDKSDVRWTVDVIVIMMDVLCG